MEHLGSDSATIRLGGIYALHHIAKDSVSYRETVFRVLCAYIRETTGKDEYPGRSKIKDKEKKPTNEIQVILDLLFQYKANTIYAHYHANLTGVYLSGAILCHAHLQHAQLNFANLRGADCRGINLQDAALVGVDMTNANFINSRLCNANCNDSRFQWAKMMDADLQDASLMRTNLTDARHIKPHQLLKTKILTGAVMDDGIKRCVSLKKPDLFGEFHKFE